MIETPRYLCGFDSLELPHRLTDVLVIGSGIAGLRCALEVSRAAKVLVVTKDVPQETVTALAQGGIAVAFTKQALSSHIEDTIKAGCGLCDEDAVETILGEGADAVKELADMGVEFDREDGEYALAREGGHSEARILRAKGDATGAEIERVLLERAYATPNIRFMPRAFVVDLLTVDGRCVGALVQTSSGERLLVWARAVVLATGGAGQIYRETTNPEISTGDGIAMAFRAGASIADMEFVQFHPTVLYVAGAIRALISEAVRGEGAYLLNRFGERFMLRYDKAGELAPRDVVSRAIIKEMKRTSDTQVYLSCRHLDAEKIRARFPSLTRLCAAFDIDFARDRVPVRPAAHYLIGGVQTDLFGRTTLEGLYACGEVAATGLHGANRLASNSLLEGLVMGRRTGRALLKDMRRKGVVVRKMNAENLPSTERILVRDVEDSLRALMWWNVGIERDESTLKEALERLGFWCKYVLWNRFESVAGWRLQNMLTVGYLVALAAYERRESRGVHWRRDAPKDSPRWRRHIVIDRKGVRFTNGTCLSCIGGRAH